MCLIALLLAMETCHYLKTAVFTKELTLLMTHFLRKNDPFYNFCIFGLWKVIFDTLGTGCFVRVFWVLLEVLI